MSLAVLADHMASKGRNGDTMLVHMTPEEVKGLHALAAVQGERLTINPETGLPEANILKRFLPTILGIGATILSGGTITPLMAGLGVGAFETVRTGDLTKGIMAGLGAYGGAGIGSALSSAGATALAGSEAALAAGQTAASSIVPETISAAVGEGIAEESVRQAVANEAARNVASQAPFYSKLGAGLEGLTSEQGRAAFMQGIGGGKGLLKAGYMAAAPLLAAEAAKAKMPQTTTPMARITPYGILGGQGGDYTMTGLGSYTPEEFIRLGGFQGLRERVARGELTPPPPPGAAGGGLMSHLADGGTPYDEDFAFAQRSEPVVRMANGGFTDERVAQALRESMGQGFSLEQSLGGAASKFGISQDQLTRAQALLNPTTANPFKASREDVLAAYKANPLAELNPNEEAINYWRTQGLGSFNDVVKSARAENPGLATFIDATRNPAATTAATTPFATAGTTLPNYLGLNAVAAGAPTTFVSNTAPTGYDYAAAQLKSQRERDINEIYNRVLGRQAEQSGLDYWANSNLSLGQIEQQVKNIAGNIGVKVDPTQLATPTAAQLAAQKSILADPQAAALAAVRSGIQAGMTDQQIADMVNMQYGKSFSAQNVADFMKANNITRPAPVVKPPVSTATDVTFGGDTVIPPYVAPQPDVTLGTPFQPTAQTMEQVRSAYVQGGGRTDMPTITNIQPTDRTYTYNEAFGLLKGYLQANPNAMYRDVVAFARSKGIPEMQAKAAYNEFRFSGLTGGSQQAYDYLMGRGAYPIRPFVPGGGPISRSYAEAMGITGGYQNLKPISFTKDQSAVASGVPKEVPPVKDPSGKQYPDLAAFYFDANPDVKEAFETKVKDMTPEDYVVFHWNTHGQKEKRKGYYKQLVAEPATYEGGGGASGGMAQDIPRMARGGLSALAALGGAAGGGQFDLGSYSDGGRLLRGPGDGVSDSIPATIGGKRPARLADGEFVVPARIVSELGNGSTEAGARKLYAMMDRVQAARRKSIGKGKVAKNSRADKYLPA